MCVKIFLYIYRLCKRERALHLDQYLIVGSTTVPGGDPVGFTPVLPSFQSRIPHKIFKLYFFN